MSTGVDDHLWTMELRIRTLTVSLLGAAVITAGLILVRQQRVKEPEVKEVPPGETIPADLSLERLRESGY